QSQIVTPKPLTPPPPTAHNLTQDPAPSFTTPPTKQPVIINATKVTAEMPSPGVPIPPRTSASVLPPDTNHTSAPPPEPTTVRGGGTEDKILTVPPVTLPVPSSTEGPFNTTLSTKIDPGTYNNTTPNASLSPTIEPSMTSNLPEISTTPYISIPPGGGGGGEGKNPSFLKKLVCEP
ncbi:receptor-type tyrosine-protein phosphatase alpha, partial [Tachysurus ichikawai]